jgi:hypothetical protein
LSAAHHIKGHGMGNKLLAFTPNLNGVLNVHVFDYTIPGLSWSYIPNRPLDTECYSTSSSAFRATNRGSSERSEASALFRMLRAAAQQVNGVG